MKFALVLTAMGYLPLSAGLLDATVFMPLAFVRGDSGCEDTNLRAFRPEYTQYTINRVVRYRSKMQAACLTRCKPEQGISGAAMLLWR
jgi:hypothetical protein